MKDKTRDILTRAGVDLDSAKERMMGNEKLLLRMLFKIDIMKSYSNLIDIVTKKDVDMAIQEAHTLKGLFGNLSVIPLYDLFSQQTSLLRSGDFSAAEALLPEVKREMDSFHTALSMAKQAEENG